MFSKNRRLFWGLLFTASAIAATASTQVYAHEHGVFRALLPIMWSGALLALGCGVLTAALARVVRESHEAVAEAKAERQLAALRYWLRAEYGLDYTSTADLTTYQDWLFGWADSGRWPANV